MLFEDVNLAFVLVPAFVLVALWLAIRARKDRQANEVTKAVARLRNISAAMGVILMLLVFLLPSTAVLGSFGLPKTPDDIGSTERLLSYMQTYSKSLTRTIFVLFLFLFLFVFWFLGAVHSLAKAVAALNPDLAPLPRETAEPSVGADSR